MKKGDRYLILFGGEPVKVKIIYVGHDLIQFRLDGFLGWLLSLTEAMSETTFKDKILESR